MSDFNSVKDVFLKIRNFMWDHYSRTWQWQKITELLFIYIYFQSLGRWRGITCIKMEETFKAWIMRCKYMQLERQNQLRAKTSYRTLQIPLFVAKITIGESELSKARFKYEKHSISNICTWKFIYLINKLKVWVKRMLKELKEENNLINE